MKREMISQALDQLDLNYVSEALENGNEMNRRKPVRRVLAGVLTAAAVLACTMGIAMAASPEFRQTVLSFFHLEGAEQVPGPEDIVGLPSEGPTVNQSNIVDGQVKAQYIQLEGAGYSSGNGTIYKVERDETGTAVSIRFWAVEDGGLIDLETRESSFAVTWQGIDYEGAFYWCVWDDKVTCYSDGAAPGQALEEEIDWRAVPIQGRTDAVLLMLSRGTQMDYWEYPYLYFLETGEMRDLLVGVDLEPLGRVMNHDWSEDLSKVILSCDNGQNFWYGNLTSHTLTQVDQLTGLDAFSAFFADDETLIVLELAGEDGTSYNAWSYDLRTGALTQTLSEANVYHSWDENPYGIQFFGERYGLYVTPSGQVSVVDLKTGTQSVVEDFILSNGGSFNPNGSRLLYWVTDDTVGGLGVSELGVLDLEKGTFISFDREGYSALHEWSLGWFDDDRAEIWAYSENSSEGQYLYLYEL